LGLLLFSQDLIEQWSLWDRGEARLQASSVNNIPFLAIRNRGRIRRRGLVAKLINNLKPLGGELYGSLAHAICYNRARNITRIPGFLASHEQHKFDSEEQP
jgi:hypothetical protein